MPRCSPQRGTTIVAETSAAERLAHILDRIAAMPVAPTTHMYVEGCRGEVIAAFEEKGKRASDV